ncbi:MAG: hypothetical protein ACLUL3_09520 [Romboutsia timonensis]|uniref:hypothetical protein n=1 Tax=Romboutsia timonensis TaxID=1776391 RepID=UPI003993646A
MFLSGKYITLSLLLLICLGLNLAILLAFVCIALFAISLSYNPPFQSENDVSV